MKLTGIKSIDKDTMNEAERIRAKRLLDLSAGKYDLEPVLTNKNFLQFYKKMIDEFPEYERRASVYKHLTGYCELNHIERLNFSDINEGFWERFKRYLITQAHHSQSTIHLVLAIIKAILNRAVRDKIILTNPLNYVREKTPKSTRTYLTLEELKKMRETKCLNDEVKQAFLFSCYTGLRLSDIEKIRSENLVNDTFRIKMKKTSNDLINPVDNKALKYIDRTREGILFNLPARSTINLVIRSWAAAAGITKKVSYHTSRHTYATLHLTYGTSIEVLRDLLGHKDVRETQIYAKIIDQKKKEAINNLPEL